MNTTRRSATTNLLGMTTLAALLSAPLAAEDKAKKPSNQRLCLGVYYMGQADARFDFDYYRDKHLKMLRDLYGKSVGKMHFHKGLRKGDGSAPSIITALTVEIRSMEAFDAAAKEHRPALLADLNNFTNIIPLAQIEEIVEV